MQNRRYFLKTGISVAAAGLAGAAALTVARRTLAEEAPPETTSVRLLTDPSTCVAPLDILDDLLREEGFSGVRYLQVAAADPEAEAVARGEADFCQDFAATAILSIDGGVPALMLAGVHPACFELFARESIRSVADLKGKTVGVGDLRNGGEHVMLQIIAASVGLDPVKDINWVVYGGDPKGLLADEKIDAFMTFPPWAQEARAVGTRPCDLQQRARPSMVAVFLLHVDRRLRFRPAQPDRHQTRGARHGPGDRHLFGETGLGRPAAGRSRLYASLRLRATGLGRRILSQLARI